VQNRDDGLLTYVASAVLNQVIVSADAHIAVFAPILTPAVFDKPVFFAVHVQSILTEANYGHRMISTLAAAITFFLKISDDSTTVVFYAIIDVEVRTDRALTSKFFQVVITDLFKHFEIFHTNGFHFWREFARFQFILVWIC